MKVWDLAQAADRTRIGREMYECIEDLYPLCRSITGEGLRETLLTRTAHGGYPEYHTSADDLSLVHPWALADTFGKCPAALGILEGDRTYLNLNPKCEPHLGKRGLYRHAPERGPGPDSRAMQWVLSFTDGRHSLLDIAERSGLPFQSIRGAAEALAAHGLLAEQGGIASVSAPVDFRGACDGSRLAG